MLSFYTIMFLYTSINCTSFLSFSFIFSFKICILPLYLKDTSFLYYTYILPFYLINNPFLFNILPFSHKLFHSTLHTYFPFCIPFCCIYFQFISFSGFFSFIKYSPRPVFSAVYIQPTQCKPNNIGKITKTTKIIINII